MADSTKYDFIIENAENIYFTSDNHFFHKNIISSCNRPFVDEFDMNEQMIKNWNAVVEPDNTVFCLGDFAWGGFNKWKQIREQLNGHIILIKGKICCNIKIK